MSKNKLDLYTNRMFSEVLQIVQSRTNNTNVVKKKILSPKSINESINQYSVPYSSQQVW